MNISKKLGIISGSKKNQKLFGNTVSLYSLQVINYIIPLITIPYLIRALGTNIFGLLAFAGSLIAYFQMIVDYGFNLSATRDISIHRGDSIWISNFFCSVLAIKLFLAFVCNMLLLGFVILVPRFQPEISLYLWLYVTVVGSIFIPTWLFQGMERMAYLAIFNLITKIIATCLYFVFIKKPTDYMWFAYLNAGASVIVGVISLIFAIRIFQIKIILPNIASCKRCIKDGFQIFISQASVSLFTNTNTFILGIFTNNQIVGTYAVAEKIVRVVIMMTGPIGAAIFPRVSIMFSESRPKAIHFLKKVLISGSVIFGLISCCLFIFSDFIVSLITGTRSHEISLLIKIMAFLPLSISIDNIFGTQIMLNINLQKQFMQIILGGGILSICILFTLVPIFNAYGSAISFVISQFVILICMIFSVRKAGIRIMGNH